MQPQQTPPGYMQALMQQMAAQRARRPQTIRNPSQGPLPIQQGQQPMPEEDPNAARIPGGYR